MNQQNAINYFCPSHRSNINVNSILYHYWSALVSINYHSKPLAKLKLNEQINSTISSQKHQTFRNIYNTLFHVIFAIFLLYLPTVCECTLSQDQIYALIDSGDIGSNSGQFCYDMDINCEYFSEWTQNTRTHRNSIQCTEDADLCILTCASPYSCHDLDIHLSEDTALVLTCVESNSCNDVSIHGNEASFIYIQANDINSMTDSQIQCPNHVSENKTCVIHGHLLSDDYDDDNSKNEHPSDAMITHIGIYSSSGYLGLSLECDSIDDIKCFGNSFMQCGGVHTDTLETCWIMYDDTHDMYVCEGDNIWNRDMKCREDVGFAQTEDGLRMTHNTDNSEGPFIGENTVNTTDAFSDAYLTHTNTNIGQLLQDIMQRKDVILYTSITVGSICCLCCILTTLVCRNRNKNKNDRNENEKREFKFVQKQNKNSKYKKHKIKLCKKCTAKSCFVYYISCCCCCYCCHCLWNRSNKSTVQRNNDDTHERNKSNNIIITSTGTDHNITKDRDDTATMDTDEPQTINPLSIDDKGGIFPSFFLKNREGRNKGTIISSSYSNTINALELVVIGDNKLHPPQQQQQHTPHIRDTIQNIKIEKLQPQQSLSWHTPQRNTFSFASNGEKYRTPRLSHSHTSHTDGLEEQAAKKIGDAKLGTNSTPNQNSYNTNNGNTPNYTPNELGDLVHNHTAFGIAKYTTDDGNGGNDTGNDTDFAYALQLQQQQLLEAAKYSKHITKQTPQNITTGGNSITLHTPTDGNAMTPQHTTDGHNTIEVLPVLDLGGGFKIGMNEDSTISHISHTSCTMSQSDSESSQFDPEDPNQLHAEDQSFDIH